MEDSDMTPALSTVPTTSSSSAAEAAATAKAAANSASAIGGSFSSPGDHSRLTAPVNHHLEMPEERLLSHPEGMDMALEQAKIWSKYAKDLIGYLEKRTQIEVEYHRSIVKNAQNLKSSIGEESFLPFQDIYMKFSGQEIENGQISLTNFDLLTQHFLSPLNDHRLEFEKKIKKIKELWLREKKQMNECTNNFNKYREFYNNKAAELTKLKAAFKSSSDSSADWSNNSSEKNEKKRRTFEEAMIREREAYEHYNKSMLACHSQRVHMTKTQRDLILKTKDLLSILEMKIKEVTCSYFETLKDSMTYSPAQISKIIEDTGKYEFGKSYRDYANSLPPSSEQRSGYGNSNLTKGDVDSSESETNHTPLQAADQLQSIIGKRSSQMNASPKLQYDERFESELNAITKEFKTCIDSMSSDVNFGEKTRKRLFGVPLTSLSSGPVPDIVRQCVEEIELSGIQINGIYRVSGVKSKVEGLCHSYETNPDGVDLSNLSPNIIANVLKHFFRELPEPLMTFQHYSDFIILAKKYASNTVEDADDIISSFKRIIVRMPLVHFNTLKYLMRHLRRIARNCAINNMPSSNLGIIFGPTLLRRNNDPNATSSTLFDATHQGRVIDLLIIYANEIFDMSDDDDSETVKSTSHNSFSREELVHAKEMAIFAKTSQQMSQPPGENFRLLKSATCSSIGLSQQQQQNQSKANIVEARRQFFTSAFNAQQQGPFYKYKPYLVSPASSSNALSSVPSGKTYLSQTENGLSPFSQLAASSSSSSTQSTYKIKKLTSANYHQQQQQQQQQQSESKSGKISQIYPKNTELSKSSSSIYSLKNSLSLITSNEDIV